MSSYLNVIAAYDGQADVLAQRYEAVSSEWMLAEMLPVIPGGGEGKLALDVGAGTGRDAAWLTSLGYEVVAAEPAAGMRRIAAEQHGSHGIRWVNDALPSLDHVHGLGLAYDFVLLSAVWQHVAPADRPRGYCQTNQKLVRFNLLSTVVGSDGRERAPKIRRTKRDIRRSD